MGRWVGLWCFLGVWGWPPGPGALAQTAAPPNPGGSSALAISPEGPLILGDLQQVTVTITAPETTATVDRPLRVSVNVGSFGPVTRVSPQTYQTTYTLPSTRFPQVALVAVWRETGPDAAVDFHRIPLSARTELPIQAKAGAEVTVVVGEVEVGPTPAPPSGQLSVPLVIPPGVERVLVRSVRGQRQAQAWVPARVPPYNHLTLALTPHRVPADGVSHATLHAYYDGPAPPIERFKISGGEGKVEVVGQEGGRAVFRFVPQRSSTGGEVQLEAQISREASSTARATLTLGLPIPERVIGRPLPGPWVADGQSITTLTVLVSDRYGLGVPGLVTTATVTPARLLETKELGEGQYQLTLAAPTRVGPDRKVQVDLHFARSDAAVDGHVELPVELPPGPADVTFTFEPQEPATPGEVLSVVATPIDAAGAPIAAEPFTVTVEGATLLSSETAGPGRRLRFEPGPEAPTVVARAGTLERRRVLTLTPTRGNLFLAALVGGGYGVQLLPSAALEVGWRTGWSDNHLSFFLRGGYRLRQADFVTRAPSPVGTVGATSHTFPIALGARYDFVVSGALRVYAHAGAGVVLGQHRLAITLDGVALPDARLAIFGPAAEVAVGASWSGIFLEVGAAYEGSSVDSETLPRVNVPPFLGSAALGYRWEVE